MNKRHHPRFKSHVEAVLITKSGSKHSCYIADFSQEGMRIFWPEGEPVSIQVQDALHIELMIEKERLDIPVLCLYFDSSSAGFHLLEPTPRLFLSFQSINTKNRSNSSLSDEKRTFYKKIFKQKIVECSPIIIDKWHNDMLEALLTKASKALNNDAQQSLFSAETKIKENQTYTQQLFLSAISEQLDGWLKGKPSLKAQEEKDGPSRTQDLSLIEQGEFEDWLIAKVTTTHLQSKLSHSSFEIRQLLDIVSEAKPENKFNPIGPVSTTEAFRLAIKPLDLEISAYRIAFQVFEKVAAQQLQLIFEWLIKRIDIPLSLRTLHKPMITRKAAPTDYQSEPEPQILPSGGDDLFPDVYGASIALASAANNFNTPSGNDSSPILKRESAPIASTSSFRQNQIAAQQAFSKIQGLRSLRASSNADSGVDTETKSAQHVNANSSQIQSTLQQLWKSSNTEQGMVRQDLEQALASQDVVLPEENREAINTLEYITKDLVENKHVSELIKPLIAELEQPLSMMMINDPSMIFNPDNPGRMALDSLSKLGLITTTSQNNVSEKLAALLTKIDISKNAEELVDQFKQLHKGVDAILLEAERRVKMNAERVAQAAAGEHLLEQAKKKITRLVNKDTAGKTLPAVVLEWLNEGWTPLLNLALLRDGADSKRFRGAVKLYRQVLSLFSSKNSGRRELSPRFTPLAKLMRHELDKLNGPLAKHALWYEALIKIAKQHLEAGEIEEIVKIPLNILDDQEKRSSHADQSVRKALNLKIGDWLLLTEKDQNVSVVWVADDNSKLACVNHSGMKVIDFTLEDLLVALDNGSVKRLYEQEGNAIDKSLDTLVQQIYSDLSDQANTDALTQASTRSHFMRHLKEEVSKLSEPNEHHSLCLLDIDQFKVINKEYGVDGGDECLKAVAHHLLEFSGDKLNCARMGSHEFAIFFPHLDLIQGEEKANKLKNLLEELEIKSTNHTFRIRLSLGVSEINTQVKNEIDLLEAAESACLSAKSKGGSRVYRYIQNDDTLIKRDEFMFWANKFNQALGANQLELLYLPVLPIQDVDKKQNQYEVIISINDGNGRQIPPLKYLQMTEHYSQMHLIDRWILKQIIQWMIDHKEDVNKVDSFMLKLSGYFMNDEFLLSFITEKVKEYGIPAHKLCFELNETSAIKNIEDATYFMHEMRKLGCKFILSDFGTGQSSFEYLKILPVDYVKIDQSFISDIMTSPADHAMVKSIHEIANFMGKTTIAEKVYDDVTFDILQNIGIDLAMETNLERALPLPELIALSS